MIRPEALCRMQSLPVLPIQSPFALLGEVYRRRGVQGD